MGCLLSKFQHKWTPTPTTTQQQDESESISTNPKKVCTIKNKIHFFILGEAFIVLCRSRVYILLYKNRMKYTSEKNCKLKQIIAQPTSLIKRDVRLLKQY